MTKHENVEAGAKAEARRPHGVSSEDLFGGRREVVILHRGARYVLRITRQGKLILNKGPVEDDERDPNT